jgi:DNA modification methylase/transcriptional regulator with XRE-family HTH domain
VTDLPDDPYFTEDRVTLYLGDNLAVLPQLADASVDAVCTDPPYGLEFMGKEWDTFRPSGARIRQPSRRDRETGAAHNGSTSLVARNAPEAYVAGHPFQEWCQAWAAECWRVLKPGGYLLAFGGARTAHRLTCGIEDAGFTIRDTITWLYAQGFPKSLDVSREIDKRRDWDALAAFQDQVRTARTRLGLTQHEVALRIGLTEPGRPFGGGFMFFETGMRIPTAAQYAALKTCLGLDGSCDAAFEAAEREVLAEETAVRRGGSWAENLATGMFSHGERVVRQTAPATDPARQWAGWGTALKPASEPVVVARKPFAGTVAANVLEHGTGALNVAGCAVPHAGAGDLAESEAKNRHGDFGSGPRQHNGVYQGQPAADRAQYDGAAGRWPANVVLSHVPLLDEAGQVAGDACAGGCVPGCPVAELDAQNSDAARFFPAFRYAAKAGAAERPRGEDGRGHPTVKPVGLIGWLARLVCPPGGTVLDLFAGSGTTGEACLIEGFGCILIERDPASADLAVRRLSRQIQTAMY